MTEQPQEGQGRKPSKTYSNVQADSSRISKKEASHGIRTHKKEAKIETDRWDFMYEVVGLLCTICLHLT